MKFQNQKVWKVTLQHNYEKKLNGKTKGQDLKHNFELQESVAAVNIKSI